MKQTTIPTADPSLGGKYLSTLFGTPKFIDIKNAWLCDCILTGDYFAISFLIYVDGSTKSTVVVLKVDHHHERVVECAHSILPPGTKLIHATGGVLREPESGEDFAVVCGGQMRY